MGAPTLAGLAAAISIAISLCGRSGPEMRWQIPVEPAISGANSIVFS